MKVNHQETEYEEVKSLTEIETEKKLKEVKLALDLVNAAMIPVLLTVGLQKICLRVSSKPLYRDVVRIVSPSFIEFTLTQLTSMVDMMMVGQLYCKYLQQLV